MNLRQIFKMSRPRFWMYLAGPYLVGFTFGAESINQFYNPIFLFSFIFFLIPANFFLYGVNDLSDQDTDSLNPKKIEHETKVNSNNLKIYKFLSYSPLLLSVPLFLFLPFVSKIFLCLFLLLSYFYSVKPVRFKQRPILDFASNILYALPGFIGFSQISNSEIPVLVFILCFLWTAAMHLFSAIPDINADKKANLNTTAVRLGFKHSLLLCVFLWTTLSVILILINRIFIVTVIYPVIPLFLLIGKSLKIEKVYWYFPIINLIAGFLLFLFAAFKFIWI